jgi:hypothetical protein
MSENNKRSVKRNSRTGRSTTKVVVGDKRYVRRDATGRFVETKGDKMFERAWKNTYSKRNRRVG